MDSSKKVKQTGAYYRSINKKKEEIAQRVIEIRDDLRRKAVVRRLISVPPTTMMAKSNLFCLQPAPSLDANNLSTASSTNPAGVCSASVRFQLIDIYGKCFSSIDISNSVLESGSEYSDFPSIDNIDVCDNIEEDLISKNQNLRANLRKWALTHNITHMAMKELMKIVNERFTEKGACSSALPEDPRTLLRTPQSVNIMPLNEGEYWHYGIKKCLEKIFRKLDESITISLTINIDGLPLFNGSAVQFWPILFNIAELPHVSAMVIGIFCGQAKSSDIDSFLTPFVLEMSELMANGLIINSHKVTVGLRCFLCDSPARAYVKGNGYPYNFFTLKYIIFDRSYCLYTFRRSGKLQRPTRLP